jgi:cation diffusion facilitator CzcD-associated flavoprotein CzcO
VPQTPTRIDVAVVGAGPFGLSVAAHLTRSCAVRTFGEPMETWKMMPEDMLLRSAWEETSLSAPGGAGSIDEWVATTGEQRVEPIPLPYFLRYAAWFAQTYAPEGDRGRVDSIARFDTGFRLSTEFGNVYSCAAVVVAVGVVPFLYVPAPFRNLPEDTVVNTLEMLRLPLEGRDVIVVGGGQGAVEAAAVAHRHGAKVELVTRTPLHWFADREPHYARGAVARRMYRLAYPVVGYGPPPINRLATRPDSFAALPTRLRAKLTRRLLRPGGSAELRLHIEGKVRVTEGRQVEQAVAEGKRLTVHLDDGTTRTVDHVILGTGVRFELDRLDFLSDDLRRQIATDGSWPVLDRSFRSTVAGVFFVGYAAEGRFGPISRFVLGADFAARRVASLLVGGT